MFDGLVKVPKYNSFFQKYFRFLIKYLIFLIEPDTVAYPCMNDSTVDKT